MAEETRKVVFKHNATCDGVPCFAGQEKTLTAEKAKTVTQAKTKDGEAVAYYSQGGGSGSSSSSANKGKE